jgi:hypothetical protein
VRKLYYGILALIVVWGLVALRLVQPILLVQISANVAGLVFVIAGLHLLYVNTRILPEPLRPGFWPRAGLVALVLFYGFFTVMSMRALLA